MCVCVFRCESPGSVKNACNQNKITWPKKKKKSYSEAFLRGFFFSLFFNPQLSVFLLPADGCRSGLALILVWQKGKKKEEKKKKA